jgi:hypothetical protein
MDSQAKGRGRLVARLDWETPLRRLQTSPHPVYTKSAGVSVHSVVRHLANNPRFFQPKTFRGHFVAPRFSQSITFLSGKYIIAKLIKHADRVFRDLPVGATGFVSVAEMEVDSELNCFLRPGIRYQTRKDILNPILGFSLLGKPMGTTSSSLLTGNGNQNRSTRKAGYPLSP